MSLDLILYRKKTDSAQKEGQQQAVQALLSVVIHPADIVHLPVAYMQSFIRFCHGAQCFPLAALLLGQDWFIEN